MRRFSALTTTAVLGAALLTGCGGGGGNDSSSSSSSYCKELKSSAATVKSFTADNSTPDFSKFADFIAEAHELADKAPSEVKDDWTTMVGAMDQLTSALDDAGIKLEDMSKLAAGQTPDGVDATKLAGLSSKLEQIASDKVTKAGDAISTHAKDTCKVDLSKLG